MLKTSELSYAYSKEKHLTFPDIICQQGEHCLILGQSGSGKTTMLNLLAGLRTPSTGSIQLKDTSLFQLSGAALDRFRGRNIGIIFQQPHFVKSLDVEANLAIAQKLAGERVNKTKIVTLLEKLQIGHKLKQKTYQLSVGEQQRVAIARALVNQPLLILADEPTSALDDQNAEKVVNLLKEQAQAANAILMIVTHDTRLKNQFDKTYRIVTSPIYSILKYCL
ncbi:MAG: ATP-binding cassette domain-containing protein [Saprospiraceae bacterium]|nr:ATP-binding cassette domain-containing protein [Saprospiraceae bacterium]